MRLGRILFAVQVLLLVAATGAQAWEDYAAVRIKKFPVAVQCWTFRKFTFEQTLDKVKELGLEFVEAYPGQKLGGPWGNAPFNHDMSAEQREWVKKLLKEKGIRLVNYGVVHFPNEREAMKKVFEFAKEMGIITIVTEPDYDDYSLIEKMVRKYNIGIAIHNHPLPSKYARPETVFMRVDGLDERIGACGDTGHWLRTGVNPVEALYLLRNRVRNLHLKDLNEFGKKDAYDVPFGQGKANIHDILAELTLQDYPGFLVIEHENPAEADNPIPSIKKGLDYIRSITYYYDYQPLLQRWGNRYNKHGWNHYGPGYFELDEKTGVLKSQGGMGLFWYSRKKFKDFILELEFKCAEKFTNSGVFLRVPEMPVSDDYIFHSFEIQIDDASQGIHRTGAVYDAEAPAENAEKPTGQWNHYKIAFIGSHITVELNGKKIIDWEAEPRGKIRDFAPEGYIGLQNHDSRAPVFFRNIYIKEINR